MQFCSLTEAATVIASLMHPSDEVRRGHAADTYRRALMDAMLTGKLVAQSGTTFLPIDPVLPHAPVAFAVSVIRLEEINRWLRHTNVPVQIDETAARGADNPQRVNETPAERRTRLFARKADLQAAKVRNFNQVLAREEGVSVSRIQQYLRAPNGKATTLESWSHGRNSKAS